MSPNSTLYLSFLQGAASPASGVFHPGTQAHASLCPHPILGPTIVQAGPIAWTPAPRGGGLSSGNSDVELGQTAPEAGVTGT